MDKVATSISNTLEMPSLSQVSSSWKKGDVDDIHEVYDCYCPNCEGNKAKSVILPTSVPGFREIIVMSITCGDCDFRSSEVTFGGEFQEKGEKITLQVTCPDDLNRQLIKSDSASLKIPQLEFEIPPGTQRGSLSTLEGFLKRAADNLEKLQPDRLKLGDIDNFYRCRDVIEKLKRCMGEKECSKDNDNKNLEEDLFPFDVVLDDVAGNSFIENLHAPANDPSIKRITYFRTPTQDMALGLQPSKVALEEGRIDDKKVSHKNVTNACKSGHRIEIDKEKEYLGNALLGKQEALKFSTPCPSCHKAAETLMCVTDIPHFKEAIIMSLLCENCGYKSNEIKGGGAIPSHGSKIILSVANLEDLKREILKSDTAGVQIPEIKLELDEGGLGGFYTTVEGLLDKMHGRLTLANPFSSGDAATKQHVFNNGGQFSEPNAKHVTYINFLTKLKEMAEGKHVPFTLIVNDPLGNSFIGPIPKDAMALSLQTEKKGNLCYSAYVDNGLKIEEYERSHEQNEYLGLNDMKTENYKNESDTEGDDGKQYYGTDKMSALKDQFCQDRIRDSDHPYDVAKAPVNGDDTVMGAESIRFPALSMLQSGEQAGYETPRSGASTSSD